MISTWKISDGFLSNIRKIVDTNINSRIVKERFEKNINRKRDKLSKNEIWYVLIGCHITSNQKSGKGSPAEKFLNSNNRILDYKKIIDLDLNDIAKELSKYQIRFNQRIARQLIEILTILEKGEWNNLIFQLKTLVPQHSREDEIKVINYLLGDGKLVGIGQKQARNFLQWLGLSIYEVPIDTRVCKILKSCGCNFVPNGVGLQDGTVYRYMEDGINVLAEKLGIKPCILDACMFNSLEIKSAK